MGNPDDTDRAPFDATARAELRRRTWTLQALDVGVPKPAPHPDPAEMLENWRRLEQLRRAACALRGEPYPERSTPEERRRWPGHPIRSEADLEDREEG